MIPKYYEFYNPVKILSGHKAVDNLPYELERLAVARPLIVTDQGVVNAGLLKIVLRSFDDSHAVIGKIFDQVPPDSSLGVVQKAAQAYRSGKCDGIVAVGGGSVVDTAKGVNIVVSEGTDDLLSLAGVERLKHPLQPLVVIPTTAGTGSEVTLVAVIADREKNAKLAFVSTRLYPSVAILDSRMTMTLPPQLTAATAMDALTHAMEAYTCLQKNPVSDAHAWAAIRIIAENLIPAVKKGKDKQRRLALANAACLAGAAFSNSMVGMIHALGHAAGALCHVPHGTAMSIFLPHGLEYYLEKRRSAIAEMLLPLAGPDVYAETLLLARAEKTIEVVRSLQRQLHKLTGLPLTLKEAGVAKDMLESIARTALDDGALIFSPEEMEYENALYVLHRAYN